MYKPLDRSTRQIRVLEIPLTADPSQPFQCRLSTVSLDNKPVYEALSYCRSPPSHPTTIIIDGNKMHIGTNLFLALERLRDTKATRTIWIDDLCIDQRNASEVAHQMSLMRDIYRHASEVIIWLGSPSLFEGTWEIIEELRPQELLPTIDWGSICEATPDELYGPENYHVDDSDAFTLGFKTACLLARDIHLTSLPHLPKNPNPDHPNPWPTACTALLNILTRSYWTRAWIIQDVVLPLRDPPVWFGRHRVPFSVLVAAGRNLAGHSHGYHGSCCVGWGYEGDGLGVGAGAEGTDLEIGRLLREFAAVRDLAGLRGRMNGKGEGKGIGLAEVLLTSCKRIPDRGATDPRDQVYGVPGLVEGSGGMVPDYSLAVAEVYAQAVFRMVTEAGSLESLALAESQRHEGFNLPSWVPDWTGTSCLQPAPYPWQLYGAYLGYHEITTSSACELRDGSTVLKVRGVVIDSVKRIGSPMVSEHQPVEELLSRLAEWRRVMQDDGESLVANSPDNYDFGFEVSDPLSSPSTNEVFWRIILGDDLLTPNDQADPYAESSGGSISGRRLGPEDLPAVAGWWTWLIDIAKNMAPSQGEGWGGLKKYVPSEYRDVFYSFCGHTRSRLFFVTEARRYGMGVSISKDPAFGSEDVVTEVQPGDLVCLLEGSRLPVVLRRHLDTQSTQPVYSYIGTCYLHGAMDGEAAPRVGSGDVGDQVDFNIGDFADRNPGKRPTESSRVSTTFQHGRQSKKSRGIA